jgi:hypothetical protein
MIATRRFTRARQLVRLFSEKSKDPRKNEIIDSRTARYLEEEFLAERI